MKWAIVIEKSENGFGAYAPDAPGVGVVGDTADEVRGLSPAALPRGKRRRITAAANGRRGIYRTSRSRLTNRACPLFARLVVPPLTRTTLFPGSRGPWSILKIVATPGVRCR
jgi:hypothetical protein